MCPEMSILLQIEEVSEHAVCGCVSDRDLFSQFKDLPTPSLGLLVGLCLPHTKEGPSHVIVGRCGCVLLAKDGLPALSSHGLPTPKWKESWERVKGCFPGGCDVCGVWMRVKEGGEVEIVRELINKTDLLVCLFCQCKWGK